MYMTNRDVRFKMPITNIRIEKIHDITDAECVREGIAPGSTARNNFIQLWDSIHPDSWDTNPLVVVYEWETVRKV